MTSYDDARRTAIGLSALCLGMGALHFAKPEPFDGLIPRQLPGTPRQWTLGSGVAELAVGALLAVPATRRIGFDLTRPRFDAWFGTVIAACIGI